MRRKLNARSYRLDAAAGTLLNLAVCNEKIGKLASAWGEFRDAASEARRMNRPDREQLATDRIKVIEPELPFLAVSVPPLVRTVRGLEITRNGIPLQSAAWDTELPVDPGDVEVLERAPGYKPKTLHITMAAKQHATLTALPLELAPIERPPLPFWTARRTTGFALMAGGVVAAGVGAFFGVQATNQKKDSDGQCPNYFGDLRCNADGCRRHEPGAKDVGVDLTTPGFGLGDRRRGPRGRTSSLRRAAGRSRRRGRRPRGRGRGGWAARRGAPPGG